MIIIKTSKGDIRVQLDDDNTPNTADNFRTYVREGLYKDTIFHRVIKNFMIQGGGMSKDMVAKKAHAPISNEAKRAKSNKRGTIAMARTSDPHSATSQFFINVVDNAFLNFTSKTGGWGYCVFGKVVEGMDIVDKIKAVATTRRAGHSDVPVDDVIIEKVIVDETKTQ